MSRSWGYHLSLFLDDFFDSQGGRDHDDRIALLGDGNADPHRLGDDRRGHNHKSSEASNKHGNFNEMFASCHFFTSFQHAETKLFSHFLFLGFQYHGIPLKSFPCLEGLIERKGPGSWWHQGQQRLPFGWRFLQHRATHTTNFPKIG